MSRDDYDRILEDAHKIRKTNPARRVVVPAILVDHDVTRFLDPLARDAQAHDGCSCYLLVRGKTFRVTIERL